MPFQVLDAPAFNMAAACLSALRSLDAGKGCGVTCDRPFSDVNGS